MKKKNLLKLRLRNKLQLSRLLLKNPELKKFRIIKVEDKNAETNGKNGEKKDAEKGIQNKELEKKEDKKE